MKRPVSQPQSACHCHPIVMLCLSLFLISLFGISATGEAAAPSKIKEINIVHFSHTDVGFTDHPAVCRDLYRRYLDVAVDTILDSSTNPPEKRFYWTAESTMPVNDWWQKANAARRDDFLKAAELGQLEIAALAFNNTPFMNGAQWQTMTHWLPEDLWQKVQPKVAIQNDVNGLPRAAATALLDRGIHYLFTGINEDSGGVPFPRPSAFWWKMPDGRRLFVWLNIGYGSGFDFFEGAEWRRGPVPLAADTRYRPPRNGDFLRTDKESLEAAHNRCVEKIRDLEKNGYTHEILTISLTSQWRFDNDPPFAPLAEFVAAWNKQGLEPRLRLTSVTSAMQQMEKVMGGAAPEYTGEWTDWWANGSASAPREVAASRFAKRSLEAVQSSVWGGMTAPAKYLQDELYRDLCLFDEHTWGSSLSVAKPYSLDTQGQFTAKSSLAFEPMARAEWLLSQRVRSRLINEGEGMFIANPAKAAFSGWVRMIATCLREKYQFVENTQTGNRAKLYFEPGMQPWGRPQKPEDLTFEDMSATFPDNAPNQTAKFWVEKLDGNTIQHLRLRTESLESDTAAKDTAPEIKTSESGWPLSIAWQDMKKPLFTEGIGEFTSIKVKGFAPRSVLSDIRGQQGEARDRMCRENLDEIAAESNQKAERVESPHTILITQRLQHPRLAWAVRSLEIWKREPRVRLTFKLNRISSALPEIFYLAFPLPTGDTLPRVSSGDMPYTPFVDQLPGTCRDYYAIDGWADYATADGRWLWVSRDAPLITFGSLPTLAKRVSPPKDVNRLQAMIFNNFWYTNFVADSHGIMEFQFDIVWKVDANESARDMASALILEPVVIINPNLKEDPIMIRDLYQP